jgi:chromosome segregation protein
VLQGFKSFADRIAIPFSPGFNVICGPNGSGKSNITEAILFALGTSSAKQIRASKLEELIFHGSKNRNPASYCIVSLYIDNSDKRLPGGEEIKISRKVTNKGLSIFRLDGKVVTRSKILDFLANANISPYGYNIIMQGDINRIIEMSPVQRREIIDQISGIQDFDEKKRKALIELEKVERHINEMKIIITEKQSLISKLEIDAKNAEEVERLNKEITKLRASIAYTELHTKMKRSGEVQNQINEYETKQKEVREILKERESRLESLFKRSREISDEIIKRSRNYELRRKIDEIKTQIIRKKDEIMINEREIEKILYPTTVVKTLIQRSGVLATISEIIHVPKKYELAINVVLGNRMNDLIVENEDVAISCIKFLKENKLGRSRFLPLDKIKSKKKIEKPSIGELAIDVIKYDTKYENIVRHILGDIVIVDNIEKVKSLTGYRVVSIDGDIVEKSGEYLGGYIRHDVSEKRKEELISLNKRLKEEVKQLEKMLKELELKEKEESKQFIGLEKERREIENQIEKIRKEVIKTQAEYMRIQEKLSKLRVEKAKIDAEIKNLTESLKEYDSNDYYKLNITELKTRLRHALEKLREIGPVNMRASEELKIIKTEYNELEKRVSRLEKEKESILKTIEEIEKHRYEKFMETLNAISEHFSVVYHDLMGGDAKLRLEEEGNLDSGLIIEASKGGKRFLNIDAMSGGEKTLTAIAFLFAIQRYQEQPFYILDEIDAALDKVNSKKVAEFIKKYSEKTQFIVISHNDITISYADTVFGVAMQDGVSKVFSIKMPAK